MNNKQSKKDRKTIDQAQMLNISLGVDQEGMDVAELMHLRDQLLAQNKNLKDGIEKIALNGSEYDLELPSIAYSARDGDKKYAPIVEQEKENRMTLAD